MDVFISWSGTASHKVAETLKRFLPIIVPNTKTFISSEIPKGDDWDKAIGEKLKTTKCGIFCITPDNTHKPWLLFEAGAISVNINDLDGEGSKVITLLLDIEYSALDFPLARFQGTKTTKEDMLKMAHDINDLLGEPHNKDNIDYVFENAWKDIEIQLNEAKSLINITADNMTPIKSSDDMLNELIESNRAQNKALSNLASSITRLEVVSDQGINKRITNLASEKDKINEQMENIKYLTKMIDEGRKNPYRD